MAGGLTIETKVIGEQRLAEVNAIIAGLEGANINPVFARAATNLTRQHLFQWNAANPNKLGGARTNFGAQCARGTNSELRPNGFVIGISQVGARQRWQGGTIRAKKAKFLTIPVAAIAHGKRAREFSALKFAVVPKYGAALVAKGTGEVIFDLTPQVVQKPDETFLPKDEQYIEEMVKHGKAYAQRLIARKGSLA